MLHSFLQTEGFPPNGPVFEGLDGNFYGTTLNAARNGSGSVFRLVRQNVSLDVLFTFTGIDASAPEGGVVQTLEGTLYGSASRGGSSNKGIVFSLAPGGKYTNLGDFDGIDGSGPHGTLVHARNGGFYGLAGGASGSGTVFGLKPHGAPALVYTFGLPVDQGGYSLYTSLVQGNDGYLYGIYPEGGTFGHGIVFKLKPSGEYAVLHSFRGTDGSQPAGTLVQALDGNFYGTTVYGGTYGLGTIFTITPQGKFTSLYSFGMGGTHSPDGAAPFAGLVQATDGNLYGATEYGGTTGYGTLFSFSTGSGLKTLYTFPSDALSGYGAVTPMIQATDGKLYGATIAGGTTSYGVIYQLDVGLKPFIKTLPAAGAVGQQVAIQGQDLSGASSVSFNGVSATFQVVSSTEILTQVPAGAVTGTVTVQLPSGALTSNLPFLVGDFAY